MSIERCSECERSIDIDLEDTFYVDGKPCCESCLTSVYNEPFKPTKKISHLISPNSSWDEPLPADYVSKGFVSVDINLDTCRTCGNRVCGCQQLADEREQQRNRGIEG